MRHTNVSRSCKSSPEADPPFARRSATCTPPRAFTLVEVMVVLAILVVIVSILLIAIRSARSGAERTASVSNLRSLATAWSSYSLDHRQQLLPGFIDEDIQNDLGVRASLADGFEVPADAAATYVWRLSPYIDHSWQTFFAEADSAELAAITAQYDARNLLELSRRPSYGLNSIFLGGDSDAAGLGALSPWNPGGDPSVAVVRLTELRSPATLVLFAPTRVATAAGEPQPAGNLGGGWHELRAPYLADRQWEVTRDGVIASSTFAGPTAGIPAIGGGETSLPVALADGSAAVVSIEELAEDMRRWTPRADTALWRLP